MKISAQRGIRRLARKCWFFPILLAGCVAMEKTAPRKGDVPRERAKVAPSSSETKLDFVDWEIYRNVDGGEGYIQEKHKKSGARAALLRGTIDLKPDQWGNVFELVDTALYPVKPGDKLELSAFVKPRGTLKSGNFIMARFYDQDRNAIRDVAEACGGDHDWRMVSLKTTVPEKAAYVAPLIAQYRSSGECYFDDVRLTLNGKNDNLLKDGGFENATAPANAAWRFAINLRKENIHALVDITGMKVNEHLVHYRGPDSLQGLTMELDYNVIRPAACYLSSNLGSQFWKNFNLSSLNLSRVYSDEKINLDVAGSFAITVPFTTREDRYFDALTKGPNTVRGHGAFYILAANGHPLGTTQTSDALLNPEKSFFGTDENTVVSLYKKTLYTLANLKSYQLEITDFHSDWKTDGWFVFKLYIIDADGEKLLMNRADINVTGAVDGKSERLEVSPVFDRYAIPRGFFIGKLGNRVPEQLTIQIKALAATPRGKETKSVEKSFPRGESLKMGNPFAREKTPREPETEGRVAIICPETLFSQNIEEGKAQVKALVEKAKQNHINNLSSFAMASGSGTKYCDVANKYYRNAFPAWDPLRETRIATKEAGIALDGILCVLPEGANAPGGILIAHPEWAMTDGKGNKVGWLDPSVPEIREYRLKDIEELMRKYDLDGILLDYCRLSLGPSDRGAEIYMKETGVDPRKAALGSNEYIAWYIWTGKHLTDFVREIRETVKKVNPHAKVSAYVQGVRHEGPLAYREYHQKFTDWLKYGYIDAIYPTGYVYDMLNFKSWCKRQIAACRQANAKIPCMPTIGVKSGHGALRDSRELVDQIDALRELGADGQSFFTWNTMRKWLDVVKKECYTKPASPPEARK